jgi:N-methylhydantoinase A
MTAPQSYILGVDIGGTFTDLVLLSDNATVVASEKVLTTPDDHARGAMEGMLKLLRRTQVQSNALASVVHSTTLTSNTMIERTGGRTALITTAGFRDILEFGREARYDVYDLGIRLPTPLVPRDLRFEVDERIAADGSVLRPLDTAQAREIAAILGDREIEAVAVCLLHSYRNPQHEHATREALHAAGYRGHIVLSAEVCPEVREYERTSTTVANAYLLPRVSDYLKRFADRLEAIQLGRLFNLFSSYGGRLTPAAARRRPVELLECGAASGVLASAAVAREVGWTAALSFDMGGTTAKVAVIEDGKPSLVRSYEVARLARFMPGSGLPIAASTVDLIEVGAGGGSIAKLDHMGLVVVGPESAGSDPGPACYGRGGDLPTVADADLVLGYLGPEGLLDGEIPLDIGAAVAAIEKHIAGPLSLSVEKAASAIHEVVVESMARAARIHAVGRGYDPRLLNIVAFGGAGPVHATALAEKLGAPEVLVMPEAGVGAAFGLVIAPAMGVVTRSSLEALDALDWQELAQRCKTMKAEALTDLGQDEVNDVALHLSCDMRYRGQGHEVDVPFRLPPYDGGAEAELEAAFSEAYRQRYGRDNPDAAAEVVSWRLEARAGTLRRAVWEHRAIEAQQMDERRIYLAHRFVKARLYRREALKPGETYRGPALIRDPQTSSVVPDGASFSIDHLGNLRIRLRGDA